MPIHFLTGRPKPAKSKLKRRFSGPGGELHEKRQAPSMPDISRRRRDFRELANKLNHDPVTHLRIHFDRDKRIELTYTEQLIKKKRFDLMAANRFSELVESHKPRRFSLIRVKGLATNTSADFAAQRYLKRPSIEGLLAYISGDKATVDRMPHEEKACCKSLIDNLLKNGKIRNPQELKQTVQEAWEELQIIFFEELKKENDELHAMGLQLDDVRPRLYMTPGQEKGAADDKFLNQLRKQTLLEGEIQKRIVLTPVRLFAQSNILVTDIVNGTPKLAIIDL